MNILSIIFCTQSTSLCQAGGLSAAPGEGSVQRRRSVRRTLFISYIYYRREGNHLTLTFLYIIRTLVLF